MRGRIYRRQATCMALTGPRFVMAALAWRAEAERESSIGGLSFSDAGVDPLCLAAGRGAAAAPADFHRKNASFRSLLPFKSARPFTR